MPTIDLVRMAQAGERDAREELFARYSGRVLDIVRIRLGKRLRSSLESGDILQEAMAEAVRSIERFEMRAEHALIGWLAKLVEHQITDKADFHGAQKRAPEREVRVDAGASGAELALPHAGPSPSMELARAEEADHVRACMAELPEASREAILQRDYMGASWDAVARETGAPSPDAARMVYARAPTRLGRLLRQRAMG